jgi:hypothetical protein
LLLHRLLGLLLLRILRLAIRNGALRRLARAGLLPWIIREGRMAFR